MTRVTDLKTLYVSHWEPTKCSTLTSVAISKGGAFFATGDEYGNVCVGSSDTKQFIRSHHIGGCVDVLFWILLSAKPFLVAATTTGDVCVWQHNATDFTLRLQHKFEYGVHALAFDQNNAQLAVSTGYDVHLFINPLQAGRLAAPVKTWTGRTPPMNGQTFLKYPVAIGLHFTPANRLLISYRTGICLVNTIYPYQVVSRQRAQLPHLIGHTSLSPSGTIAVAGNLFNGFDVFSISSWRFIGSNDYLYTARGRKRGHQMVPINSAFLNDEILVAGHIDSAVCVFKLGTDGAVKPIIIDLEGLGEKCGVQHVAASFYQEAPLIIAVAGTKSASKLFFIEGKSSVYQTELKIQNVPILKNAVGPSREHPANCLTTDHDTLNDHQGDEPNRAATLAYNSTTRLSFSVFWSGLALIFAVLLKIISDAA